MVRVAVVGVGCSRFGVRNDVTVQELAFEAVKEAVNDRSITQEDIELSVVGSVATRLYELYPAVPVNEYVGLEGKGPLRVEAACATGSAAVILASEAKVKELNVDTPIWIEAMGYSSDTANLVRRNDYLGLMATVKAAQIAYRKAGVTPSEADVATVHDCFTIAEIMAYEDLGFCPKGQGGRMVEEGQTEVGGRIPVNLDGGLKAKGHPLGATGVSMIYELTK